MFLILVFFLTILIYVDFTIFIFEQPFLSEMLGLDFISFFIFGIAFIFVFFIGRPVGDFVTTFPVFLNLVNILVIVLLQIPPALKCLYVDEELKPFILQNVATFFATTFLS